MPRRVAAIPGSRDAATSQHHETATPHRETATPHRDAETPLMTRHAAAPPPTTPLPTATAIPTPLPPTYRHCTYRRCHRHAPPRTATHRHLSPPLPPPLPQPPVASATYRHLADCLYGNLGSCVISQDRFRGSRTTFPKYSDISNSDLPGVFQNIQNMPIFRGLWFTKYPGYFGKIVRKPFFQNVPDFLEDRPRLHTQPPRFS